MTDRITIRMIVLFMGLASLAVIAGGIFLANDERSLPDALIALGGVALGNLGTFLVSTRGSGDAEPVTVVNTPDDAVPGNPT